MFSIGWGLVEGKNKETSSLSSGPRSAWMHSGRIMTRAGLAVWKGSSRAWPGYCYPGSQLWQERRAGCAFSSVFTSCVLEMTVWNKPPSRALERVFLSTNMSASDQKGHAVTMATPAHACERGQPSA